MEEGENITACIIRETKEETGIEVQELEMIGLSTHPEKELVIYPNGDQVQYFTVEFLATKWVGTPRADNWDTKRFSLKKNHLPPVSLPTSSRYSKVWRIFAVPKRFCLIDMNYTKHPVVLFLIFWLLGMTPSLTAQSTFRPELALGLRAGYQFSRVNFDVNIPQRFHTGFSSGLILQYLSQKQLGIQLEVNYSQRGLSAPSLGQALTVLRDFDYIEIPFLTHFAIGKKSFRLVINVGSYLSFLVHQRQANSFAAEYYYLLPLERNWAYGLAGGLGLALRNRLGVFQLESRAALGFTDLFPSAVGEVFSSSPELFFGAQFSYLYRFGVPSNNADPIPDDSPTNNF